MSPPKEPSAFNKPNQAILAEADVDGLGQAVLTLCHELWIVKDRMAILEVVLDKHGINAAAEVEAFQPDETLQKKLNADGRALIERVIGALNGD